MFLYERAIRHATTIAGGVRQSGAWLTTTCQASFDLPPFSAAFVKHFRPILALSNGVEGSAEDAPIRVVLLLTPSYGDNAWHFAVSANSPRAIDVLDSTVSNTPPARIFLPTEVLKNLVSAACSAGVSSVGAASGVRSS